MDYGVGKKLRMDGRRVRQESLEEEGKGGFLGGILEIECVDVRSQTIHT